MIPLKWFKPQEFDSPDSPGTGERMDPTFLMVLDAIRGDCGFPFIVHSAYRTPSHNTKVGGVNGSSHEKGKAADVEVINGWQKFRLVQVALCHGVRRIGIGKTFVHLDTDETKPQDVIWTYETSKEDV